MKVKIFDSSNGERLQEAINIWLSHVPNISILWVAQSGYRHGDTGYTTISIFYTAKES